MRLQALGALAGVADGPDALVDLAQDRLGLGLHHAALARDHLEVDGQFLREAELLGQLVHDHVVGAALPQRLDDLLAPLERAVRRRARTAGLELRAGRQQVDGAVLVQVFGLARHRRHRRRGAGEGVDHDQQVELVQRLLHLEAAALRVRRVAPEEQAAQVAFLVDQLVLLEHAVDPARHRHAGLGHHARRVLLLDPLEVDAPDLGEVLPRAFGQAVVAGQRVGVGADVGGALHVVVAAEDVGAAAADADVAQRQLQQARGAHDGVADGVLGLAHAPDDGARAVLRHDGGDLQRRRPRRRRRPPAPCRASTSPGPPRAPCPCRRHGPRGTSCLPSRS